MVGNSLKGKYVSHKKYGAEFEQQWISNQFIKFINNTYTQGDEEEIALSSNKITEVFRIEPKQLDFGLDINPFSVDEFKAACSKGAFYSASFLLQRTLANDLDIDPKRLKLQQLRATVYLKKWYNRQKICKYYIN